MGSTKASGGLKAVARGLKERAGPGTDPVRPRNLGLVVGDVVEITGLGALTSDICRTEGLEICFMVKHFCT